MFGWFKKKPPQPRFVRYGGVTYEDVRWDCARCGQPGRECVANIERCPYDPDNHPWPTYIGLWII